jgi:hypothetical protein
MIVGHGPEYNAGRIGTTLSAPHLTFVVGQRKEAL